MLIIKIKKYFLNFSNWLDFLMAMTEKEIKARYKHAVLGFLWVFLNPVLQMAVIGLVFQFFVPVEVDNYFLFLISGLLPWNFFSMTVTKTTPMYFYERALLQKAKFPREAIVLSIVLSNLFHFLASLILLLPFSFIFYGLSIVAFLPWIFLGIFWMVVLTAFLSLLLSTWNVQFRDMSFIVQAVMPLWFYLTPVIYNLKLVPEQWRNYFYLNPMVPIIELFRIALIRQPVLFGSSVIISVVVTAIIVILAITEFRKRSPNFDDWM